MNINRTPAICGLAICGQTICSSNSLYADSANVSAADYGENPKINLATGRMIYENIDLSIGGGTYSIGVSHIYNSAQNVNFNFCGAGWKLNAHQKLMCINGIYKYIDAKGEVNTFVPFDSVNSRFYNAVDAGQVLTVPNDGLPYISDGIGNKIYFNSDGNISHTVSAYNANVVKVFEYDSVGRLIKIYDQRLKFSDRIRSYLSFEYSDNLLQSITAYDNYSKIASRVTYEYEGNKLVKINLCAYDSEGVQIGIKESKALFYNDDGRLMAIVDKESKSACMFAYDERGRILSVDSGVLILRFSGSTGVWLESGYFASKRKSEYSYYEDNGAVYETDIKNEDGIITAFYLDTKYRIVSQFERTDSGNLLTLKQEKGKPLVFANYSDPGEVTINGKNTYKADSTISANLNGVYNFSHYNKNDNKYFDCSFWLKHNSDEERLKVRITYKLSDYEGPARTIYVWVNGRAKNAWQKVSVSLDLTGYGTTFNSNTLASIYVSLESVVNRYAKKSFIISDLYFTPAPQVDFYLKNAQSKTELLSNISNINIDKIDGTSTRVYNQTDDDLYFTENDIVRSLINKSGFSMTVNGVKCFDIICNDGAKRISNVREVSYDSYLLTDVSTVMRMPNNKVKINQAYSFSSSRFTLSTTNIYKEEGITSGKDSKNDKSTSSEIVYNYKGQKLSETDEYGIKTEYVYDNFGQLLKTQKKSSGGTLGEVSEVVYDENKENVKSFSFGFDSSEFNYMSPFALNTERTEKSFNGSTYDLTDNIKKNTYGEYKDRITSTAQYNGTQKAAQNNITYDNGRIRKVSNGYIGYGVKHNFEFDEVKYTKIVGDKETALQLDSIERKYETVKLHKSAYYNSGYVETEVNKYGKIRYVKSSGEDGIVRYEYQSGLGSSVTKDVKVIRDGFSGDTISYLYDKYNNLYGWSGGGLIVEQITACDTMYIYSDKEKYCTQVQYDANKIMSPRVSATVVMSDTDGNSSEDFKEVSQFTRKYSYDTLGRLTKKEYSKGDQSYSYVLLNGRNTNIPSGTSYSYYEENSVGTFSKTEYSLGYGESYGYDSKGNLTSVNASFNSSIIKREFSPYVPVQSTSAVDNDEQKKSYVYDYLNRLTKENDSKFGNKTYTYGANGKLSQIVVDNVTKELEYDENNQLKSYNGTAYIYDIMGNRTSRESEGDLRKYTYKRGNLLSGIKRDFTSFGFSFTSNVKYTYNVDGVRVKKEINGTTTKYYLDGNKILGEDRGEDKLRYFYDIDGLCGIRYNGKNYTVLRNAFGDVTMILKDGSVIARYFYDAWGNCQIVQHNDEKDIAHINPFRWKGHYFDSESGLYYANGSYYDPEVGLHVDAAPVSAMIDNAAEDFVLDINGIMCDNILAYLPNAYSIYTTVELSANLAYEPDHDKQWWKLAWQAVVNWFASVVQWFNELDIGIKIGIGLALLAIACIITAIVTVATGGTGTAPLVAVMDLLIDFAIGVVSMVAISTAVMLINGENLAEALPNVIADAIFLGGVFAFIASGVNAIKAGVRGIKNAKFVGSSQTGSQPSSTINSSIESPQPPNKITGFTKHGINQAISRDGHGVSTKGILDAFKNPKSVVYNSSRQTFKFTGQNSVVVLNQQGKVVSTWATSSIYWRF